MKIISKFKDYYDGYAEYSKGDIHVKTWLRDNKDIEIDVEDLNFIHDMEKSKIFSYSSAFDSRLLVIAGKVFPIVRKRVSIDSRKEASHRRGEYIAIGDTFNTHDTFFDFESFSERYEKSRDYYARNNALADFSWYKDALEKFYKYQYPDLTELCVKYKTPILLFRLSDLTNGNNKKTIPAMKDVNLKKYQLSKLFKSYEIYQMLDMFVSNALVEDRMPINEVSDLDKIQAHGFDKKTSFRKGKQKK